VDSSISEEIEQRLGWYATANLPRNIFVIGPGNRNKYKVLLHTEGKRYGIAQTLVSVRLIQRGVAFVAMIILRDQMEEVLKDKKEDFFG